MTGVPVALRPAGPDDAELLWRWRNDPATRQASFDPAEIPLERHRAWLDGTLRRPDRRLYVATVAGVPVGSVRLDIDGAGAEVSVTVAPDHRARGLGPRVLDAVAEEAFARLGLTRLLARVRAENGRSRRAFERAGFAVASPGPPLLLVRARPAAKAAR